MVNTETPDTVDNFKVDLGGREVEQFFQLDLPTLSIPVVEHNAGSSEKRYPTKHAERPDWEGTFTALLYARGEKNSIDEWWAEITNWESDSKEQSISVTAYAPDGEVIGRWEFETARLVQYEYVDSLNEGDAMKIAITVSYRKMKRAEP
jgi:hypothetical protein